MKILSGQNEDVVLFHKLVVAASAIYHLHICIWMRNTIKYFKNHELCGPGQEKNVLDNEEKETKAGQYKWQVDDVVVHDPLDLDFLFPPSNCKVKAVGRKECTGTCYT